MPNRSTNLAATIGVGLLLAGCGSSGSAAPEPARTTTAASAKVPPTSEGAAVTRPPTAASSTSVTSAGSAHPAVRAKDRSASGAASASGTAPATSAHSGATPQPPLAVDRTLNSSRPPRARRGAGVLSGLCARVLKRAGSGAPSHRAELERLCRSLQRTSVNAHKG